MLWAVWEASGLAAGLQAASAAGGTRGSVADADLDAVVALFDAAARFTERLPQGSTWLFLDSLAGQEIAGDTLAERAPRGETVTVLTAHKSKGLEWDLVVVAGVQEGTWPDLRQRGSLLDMDDLVDVVAGREAGPAADAVAAAAAARLLAEERRLFYVAVTRARSALLVTAVGAEDAEDRPSRFLAELAGDDIEIEHVAGSGHRWLSLPALTADLRRAVADGSLPAPVRAAAAGQLARLAAAGVRGASPAHWYALTELTAAGEPITGRVRVSPSRVESFTRCGLRWLLEAAVGASVPGAAQHLGVVIHAAAALAAEGADDGEVAKRIDELWQHLDFGSAWYSARQRGQAETMVRKFLDWHRTNPRELVAVEQELRGRPRRHHDHRPGRPAGARRGRRRHRGRPEDRQQAVRRRPGPQPPARRLPARGAARGVRAARPQRAGRGRAGARRQGRADRERPGAGPAQPSRRPGAGVGAAAGRDRRERDGGPGLHRDGQPGLPGLPGRDLLPGR